jgi:cold shock CspA family protein
LLQATSRLETSEKTDMLSRVIVASSLAAACGFSIAPMRPVVTARAAVSMEIVVGDATLTGECKWFNREKGFGFISVDGEEQDVFVHQSEIYAEGFRSLADGEKLEFKVEADPKNPAKCRAAKVTGPGGVLVQGTPY